MLADKAIGPFPFGRIDEIGLNGPAAFWHFIQNRKIQISVNDESQRSGDGRSGHDQHVRVPGFLCQRHSLGYAEPVLLVSDNQTQPGKGYAFLQ